MRTISNAEKTSTYLIKQLRQLPTSNKIETLEWSFSTLESARKFFHRKRAEMGFCLSDITKSKVPALTWKCGSISQYGCVLRLDEE